MEEVVHGKRGTARRISEGIDYRIAGKTGTVQVIRRKQDEEFDLETTPKKFHPHGVFYSICSSERPRNCRFGYRRKRGRWQSDRAGRQRSD